MKVRMVDVAKKLGISKATVSLAVNGKPGISEETRAKVFACIEQMEKLDDAIVLPDVSENTAPRSQKLIKVVIINHHKQVVKDPELDLWSDVMAAFDREARKMGYLYGLTYLDEDQVSSAAVVEECNQDMVAGVILFGTELQPEDFPLLSRIRKPLVVYDYEMPDGRYSSVCIDNRGTVEQAVELLVQAGAGQIVYLSTDKDIYNFNRRRLAFRNVMERRGEPAAEICSLGSNIMEITERAQEWLASHPLPEGFLFENYQVSIGVLTALRRLGITDKAELRMTGIDQVPSYMLSGTPLTQMKIPHAERAAIAMELLEKEINHHWQTKVKVFAAAVPVFGEK